MTVGKEVACLYPVESDRQVHPNVGLLDPQVSRSNRSAHINVHAAR